jgi:phosphate transport system substrate-binding protein
VSVRTLLLILPAMFLISCRQRVDENSPTSGKLNILCDEAVYCAFKFQKDEFEKNYPHAWLHMKLCTTNYAIGSLLNNDVECIISTRELDSVETEFLIHNDIQVYSQKLALDGIAFLVNTRNPVNELNLDQIRNILTAKTAYWNDLSDAFTFTGNVKNIEIAIDGSKSGNYHIIKNQVLGQDSLSSSARILPGDSITSSAERIMKHIAANEGAIGYVSTAWLGNNSEFLKVSKDVKILRISSRDYERAVQPIPGYLYRGDYPLRRVIYIMHRQKYIGLAAGFTAYLAGNEGQRIFLNNNLVPVVNPVRLKYE